MSIELFTFYAFSTVLVAAGLGVILFRNPVHAALSLVLCFFTAAGIWMLLRAEFLAITLVLVYVGAVMVLFLFVVMMLDINIDRLREGFWAFLVPGVVVGFIMIAEMVLVVSSRYFGPGRLPRPADPGAGFSNTRALGRVLYTDYVYAFEIAAVLLLVAIVAAIALTMRKRKDTKYVDPAAQVRVRREERVRLVSMTTEKD
jgi:NADH-quinone oxidoreductase subunit J